MRKLIDWWRGRRIAALFIQRAGFEASHAENERAGYFSPHEAFQLGQVKEKIRQLENLRYVATMRHIDKLTKSIGPLK